MRSHAIAAVGQPAPLEGSAEDAGGMDFLASAASWVTGVLGGGAAAPAATAPAPPRRMLPVTLVYATTTGTARRFAETLQKELFAMGLAGFWFRTQLVDAAGLSLDAVDALLDDAGGGALVVLLPTWTGGEPPAAAALLCGHVRDLATDFRVDKAAYAHLRFAVFALGSSAYEEGHHARAGRELDAHLRALSARPLVELGVGDDTDDMQREFTGWAERGLYPALCELYAAQCGSEGGDEEEEEEEEEEAEEAEEAGEQGSGRGGAGARAALGGGGGGCGPGAAGGGRASAATAASSLSSCASAAGVTAGSSSSCCGGSGGGGGGGGGQGACGCAANAAPVAGAAPASAWPVDRRTLRGQGVGYGDHGELTLRQWRKARRAEAAEKKAAADAAARAEARRVKAAAAVAAAAAAAVPSAPSAAAAVAATPVGAGADDGGVDLTEEDLENDRLLAEADLVDESSLSASAAAVAGAAAAAAAGAVAEGFDDSDDSDGGAPPPRRQGAAAASAPAASGGGAPGGSHAEGVGDLEDLGAALAASAQGAQDAAAVAAGTKPPPEMLTPAQRASLTKEGYQLIGSHSAVKLCRWTKAQLRGRGCVRAHVLRALRRGRVRRVLSASVAPSHPSRERST